jgi:putative heme-binding domain-containing protein
VWALTRIEDAQARSMMRVALSDSDNSVRHAAAHSASAWRDTGAFEPLTDLLKQSSPALKRVAAEALGRLGDRRAVPQILATAGESHDRVLEHSLTYALIEIADPALTAAGLQATSPYTRRATLIALDQMDGGGLKPEQVTPLLSSSDAILKQTAAWIVSRHSEWGGVLAGFFRQRLMDRELNGSRRDELQHQLTQFAGNPAIQQLLADSLRGPSSTEARLTALRAMAKAAAKEMPAAWAAGLADALAATEPEIRSEAVATARALPVPKESSPALSAALVRVARDRQAPTPIRLEALAAISGGLSLVDDSDLFTLLCQSLAPSQPVTNRGNASTVLSKAKLSASQLNVLVESVKSAGPLELNTLLSAFANTSDPHLGLRLAAALGQSKGLLSLRPDLLDQVLSKFPATVRKEGEKLLASLNVDTARQKRHLDELEVTLKGGDIRRGQTVFNSTKAACSACHAIGYLGGKAGPDLTKIGQIRGERDLLESIIYPSASFVRSYEPVVVVTRAGDVHNGVIREDSSNEILLSTGPRNEVRVLRSEIREMRPGTVSVMPSGLQQQLSRQELADLLAFLKATKWGVR